MDPVQGAGGVAPGWRQSLSNGQEAAEHVPPPHSRTQGTRRRLGVPTSSPWPSLELPSPAALPAWDWTLRGPKEPGRALMTSRDRRSCREILTCRGSFLETPRGLRPAAARRPRSRPQPCFLLGDEAGPERFLHLPEQHGLEGRFLEPRGRWSLVCREAQVLAPSPLRVALSRPLQHVAREYLPADALHGHLRPRPSLLSCPPGPCVPRALRGPCPARTRTVWGSPGERGPRTPSWPCPALFPWRSQDLAGDHGSK